MVQQSGILLRAREIRFKHREKSKQMTKRAAIRRETLKKLKKYKKYKR